MLTKCVDEMKVPLNQITEYQVSMYQQLGKLYVRIILFVTIDEYQWYNGMGKSNTCKKNARPKERLKHLFDTIYSEYGKNVVR